MAISIKSGGSADLAAVTADGELAVASRITNETVPIASARLASAQGTFAPGQTGVVGPVDVSRAGNVTFIIKNTVGDAPFEGAPLIYFEQSDDGVTWAALPAVRSDTHVARHWRLLEPNLAGRQLMFDAEVEGAASVRARVAVGPATNSMDVVIQPGAWPFTPVVAMAQPSRTTCIVSGTGMAVGTSGTESMLTLTRVLNGTEQTTGTSFVIPAGRVYRVQALVLSQIGNSTNSPAQSTFRLKFSRTGPVTWESVAPFRTRLATMDTPGDYASLMIPFDGGFDMAGDGVASYGVSVQSVYSGGNAPTVDVAIIGYEY